MNCLRANLRVIDGSFNVLNKKTDPWNFTEDDVSELFALFQPDLIVHMSTYLYPQVPLKPFIEI